MWGQKTKLQEPALGPKPRSTIKKKKREGGKREKGKRCFLWAGKGLYRQVDKKK